MCIFCGGQCGGMGEFLISLGLPFLALYFFRIKRALATLKNRVLRRATDHGYTGRGRYLSMLRGITGGLSAGPVPALKSSRRGPAYRQTFSSCRSDNLARCLLPANPRTAAANTALRGVKGWLLLICLNFTIIIPAAYLYQLNCLLDLYTYMQNRIFLVMTRKYYSIL